MSGFITILHVVVNQCEYYYKQYQVLDNLNNQEVEVASLDIGREKMLLEQKKTEVLRSIRNIISSLDVKNTIFLFRPYIRGI